VLNVGRPILKYQESSDCFCGSLHRGQVLGHELFLGYLRISYADIQATAYFAAGRTDGHAYRQYIKFDFLIGQGVPLFLNLLNFFAQGVFGGNCELGIRRAFYRVEIVLQFGR
jgi:hypothetical protein